jgi:hypothetical protein
MVRLFRAPCFRPELAGFDMPWVNGLPLPAMTLL